MTNVETDRLEEARYWSDEAMIALREYADACEEGRLMRRAAAWDRLMLAVKADKDRLVAAVRDEPVSGAEVEAAAKALYEKDCRPDEKGAWLEGPWDATDDGLKIIYREYAHAALADAREVRDA